MKKKKERKEKVQKKQEEKEEEVIVKEKKLEKKEEEIQIEEGMMIESPKKKLKNMMKLMIEIEIGIDIRKEMIDTKEKK